MLRFVRVAVFECIFRFAGSASNTSSQYGNFSASAKLKDAATGGAATHYDR